MTTRIPCCTPGCKGMILPATAERTGGFCMPCVQAKARDEHQAYVRANIRDVNEFAGVTDAIEIIKIHHRPRKRDELANWIPYPRPIDQVYVSLALDQTSTLKDHVFELIKSDRFDEAEEILKCLAAFTDASLDDCISEFLNRDLVPEPLTFRNTSAEIRDRIIALFDLEEVNRNSLLLVLAWIGDLEVVTLFDLWKRNPPLWVNSLFVAPHLYAHEAGWELTDSGKRRDLFFQQCTALSLAESTQQAAVQVAQKRTDVCSCARALINLIEFEPRAFSLPPELDALERIQVATCDECTAYHGPVFARRTTSGSSGWTVDARRDCDSSVGDPDLPGVTLHSAGARRPTHAASWLLPTTFSQIGGLPSWIQDAEYPSCPSCKHTMMFLAQISTDELGPPAEGIYYSFICASCAVTATTYQQS